ncbi:Fic family protein [Crocinitomix catalasitica]|uniref:Fic family protein n=1 Tax=Crocinitomix catalasitica TaxID=184607 RepID=UPI001B80426A|nr:Fic family protein [Crocinitomix catalasitica]
MHYQFESIHPFYDGNGRTGRILNILYLIINDLLDIPILYLSSYINENKKDCYRLLNQVNKSDEWEEYILYILKAVEVTSNRTIAKINAINNLLSQTIETEQNKAPNIYRKELIELLFEQPYSKIDFVVQKLKVERKAAARYLNHLEKLKILSSEKIGR